MPKRRRDEEKSILERLRKLEKRMRRSRSRRRRLSSEETVEDYTSDKENVVETEELLIADSALVEQPSTDVDIPKEQEHRDTTLESEAIDEDILNLLGEDPSSTKLYSDPIQKDVAVRWEHIATNGLSKDQRKILQEQYLPPDNCKLVCAPEINPEIKAAISEFINKKDKGIESRQRNLTTAISCIGKALTKVISSKDTELVKLLNDAGRILCDCTFIDSKTRRNSVMSSLKKEIKDQIIETKIDKYLFGTELNEKLKAAKAITKQGAEIKNKFSTTTLQKGSTAVQNRPLNRKAPLQPRVQPGPQKGGRTAQPSSSAKRPPANTHQYQRHRHPYNKK